MQTGESMEIKVKIHLVPVTEVSPLQKAAWEKLWIILLKENQDKATGGTRDK
jgi:hypothetical protein